MLFTQLCTFDQRAQNTPDTCKYLTEGFFEQHDPDLLLLRGIDSVVLGALGYPLFHRSLFWGLFDLFCNSQHLFDRLIT